MRWLYQDTANYDIIWNRTKEIDQKVSFDDLLL